ncbi:16S rRNA (cytosine(1402)-N(4))-methyltransferase [Abditibacterium utsteinense]|uniref:Ribosomal RNA small subunit methyltransferase H n=1 Tax=Abditibacterium utsteinense TaxID=1960156 RepID=A0A2S8SQD7_9BACT|nr:16S rRNA (cytosine(1402)-N(4))-methyltransferase [Abditibacterium utsteinense]
MVAETLEFLACRSLANKDSGNYKPDAVFLDGTLGTGGHTLEILKAHPTCRVVAFDRDAESQKIALGRLEREGVRDRVTTVLGDFRNAPQLLQPFFENLKVGSDGRPIREINGALVDAGMSLYQVTWPERGLSFRGDGPLDMRYNRTGGVSAFDLVNRLTQNELEDLIFQLADERWARRIAQFIAAHRQTKLIATTSELAKIVEEAIPAGVRHQSRVHPATKTFAALRLAVNDEFWALDHGSVALSSVLAPSARLVVLTYSSNEDRTVKRTFRRLAGREGNGNDISSATRPRKRNVSPKQSASGAARSSLASFELSGAMFSELSLALPFDPKFNIEKPVPEGVSGLGETWKMKILTSRPVVPTDAEIASNPLSRSCKLRAVEKEMLV